MTETDLASRWLGGSVIAASDESFGEKENLLNPAPAAFEPGRYGPRGEIVDGWETRRRRSPGHDWAMIRPGAPGIITSVDVDTSFFSGNYPPAVSLEACGCEGYPGPDELAGPGASWEQIIPPSEVTGDGHNVLPVTDGRRFTHVRLAAYPDGGIARLRVFGRVVPDPRGLDGLTVDLASQEYGGVVVASSDDFYTSASHLNRPDRARTMGEGWETRRRRDAGHDHVLFRLAFAGSSGGSSSIPRTSSTTRRPRWRSTARLRIGFRPVTRRGGCRCWAGPGCSPIPGTSSPASATSRPARSASTPSRTAGCRGCA